MNDIQRELLKKSLVNVIKSGNHLLTEMLPSDWAEKYRVMTTDVSPFPGPFSYEKTPYLIEPVNCLSPSHPARVISVMKGAQIGFSTGVIESGIGWIMSQNPGNILFLTGDNTLSKEAMDKKIDQMIDSAGLRSIMGPQTKRKKNQRTGDTSSGKEFPGGSLVAGSAQNANKLRQRSMRYGFIDDFEAAPVADKKAGSITSLIETRFEAYYNIMKLYYVSTPEMKHTSNIEPVYLLGDQRHYFVPCPLCGVHIDLLWSVPLKGSTENERAGIYYEVDNSGRYIEDSTGYICQECGGFFKDKHKYEMNLAGIWKPTTTPSEPGYYSYLINSLYAPAGMTDWEGYVRRWIKANPKGKPPVVKLLKTFMNTVLAQTFEETGESPKVNALSRQTRSYEIGLVPDQLSERDGNGKIVLLTCAADLNGTTDDARLDYEIVAWSESGASYSVDHGSIGTFKPRRKKEPEEGREIRTYRNEEGHNIWDEFQLILNKDYLTEEGQVKKIMITGIDTGHFTHFAYTFIDNANSFVIGLKGRDEDQVRKLNADTPYYTGSKEKSALFLIYVNLVKDELAEKIKLTWRDRSLPQPAGYMNFPIPSDNKYNMNSFFSHYEGEHRIAETNTQGEVTGMVWVKRTSSAQNHFWDCRVYNVALKEIVVGMTCKELKIKYPSWQMYIKIIKGEM